MKLCEVTEETLIRNSIGRVVTSKMMIAVLSQVFGHDFTVEEVTPFVKSFNIAMQDLSPYDEDAERSAKIMWSRLDAELSHRNKRTVPYS